MNTEELKQELDRVKTQRDILARQLNEVRKVVMMESPYEAEGAKALASANCLATCTCAARIQAAFPELKPSAGYDVIDELCGLLRVARMQRDDYERLLIMRGIKTLPQKPQTDD